APGPARRGLSGAEAAAGAGRLRVDRRPDLPRCLVPADPAGGGGVYPAAAAGRLEAWGPGTHRPFPGSFRSGCCVWKVFTRGWLLYHDTPTVFLEASMREGRQRSGSDWPYARLGGVALMLCLAACVPARNPMVSSPPPAAPA